MPPPQQGSRPSDMWPTLGFPDMLTLWRLTALMQFVSCQRATDESIRPFPTWRQVLTVQRFEGSIQRVHNFLKSRENCFVYWTNEE